MYNLLFWTLLMASIIRYGIRDKRYIDALPIYVYPLIWIFKRFWYTKWFWPNFCHKNAGPFEPFLSYDLNLIARKLLDEEIASFMNFGRFLKLFIENCRFWSFSLVNFIHCFSKWSITHMTSAASIKLDWSPFSLFGFYNIKKKFELQFVMM